MGCDFAVAVFCVHLCHFTNLERSKLIKMQWNKNSFAVAIVIASLAGPQWLLTEEKIRNPNYNGSVNYNTNDDGFYITKYTKSSLWILCFAQGKFFSLSLSSQSSCVHLSDLRTISDSLLLFFESRDALMVRLNGMVLVLFCFSYLKKILMSNVYISLLVLMETNTIRMNFYCVRKCFCVAYKRHRKYTPQPETAEKETIEQNGKRQHLTVLGFIHFLQNKTKTIRQRDATFWCF